MTTKEKNIQRTFSQESPRLKNFIKREVASAEDAEDIMQDVFLGFVKGFDDITDIGKSISWLYSVAKNKIVDYRRKKKPETIEEKQRDAESDDNDLSLLDMIPSIAPLPDEQMVLDAIWEEIEIRLEKLPQEQREVFEWHELEGLSFQEISNSTGIAINTLISRKRYAVLYLREHLEEMFELIKYNI